MQWRARTFSTVTGIPPFLVPATWNTICPVRQQLLSPAVLQLWSLLRSHSHTPRGAFSTIHSLVHEKKTLPRVSSPSSLPPTAATSDASRRASIQPPQGAQSRRRRSVSTPRCCSLALAASDGKKPRFVQLPLHDSWAPQSTVDESSLFLLILTCNCAKD